MSWRTEGVALLALVLVCVSGAPASVRARPGGPVRYIPAPTRGAPRSAPAAMMVKPGGPVRRLPAPTSGACCSACAAPGRATPAAGEPRVSPARWMELHYLGRLKKQPVATVEDLLRLVARFAGCSPDWGPLRSRAGLADFRWWLRVTRGALDDQGILPRQAPVSLDEPLRRGPAALLFARALGLRGGLTGALFGLGERAAYHEVVDEELLPAGGENYPVSGAELLGLFDGARKFEQASRSRRSERR